MKITCQSCHSKYNVADEKVQGKVVKIRCRKCGATIVVNGTAAATSNGSSGGLASAEAAVPARGGDEQGPAESGGVSQGAGTGQWHVNVAENDQRTMTLDELVAAYHANVVTQDTYLWTDGMDDWKPMGEVEAAMTALHGPASAEQAPHGLHAVAPSPAIAAAGAFEERGAFAKSTNGEAEFGGLGQPPGDAGADQATRVYEAPELAAAASASTGGGGLSEAIAPKTEAKRAAVVKRETRTRDLFASRAEEGPGAFDMAPNAPAFARSTGAAPPDDASKRTGERNENSVLFSLAVLTQSAEQRAPNAESSATDDSGLIDLKALAAKTESMRPAATAADPALFSAPLGSMAQLAPPLGAIASPLGGPPPKSRLPMIIGGIAGLALFLIAAGVVGARFFASGSAAEANASLGMPSASAAIAAPSASTNVAAPPSAAAQAGAAPSATTSAAAPQAGALPGRPRYNGGGGLTHPQAAKAGGGAAAAGGAEATPPSTPPPPPPAKKTSDCGCNGDLMCLMKCSTH
jgi:predicted Zn finger-like uncharacterized protein